MRRAVVRFSVGKFFGSDQNGIQGVEQSSQVDRFEITHVTDSHDLAVPRIQRAPNQKAPSFQFSQHGSAAERVGKHDG